MMNKKNHKKTLLALETTGEMASVALKHGDCYSERSHDAPRAHSQQMLPMLQALLEAQNLSMRDVDGIICSEGPGMFTGVRIGVAIAKGLAYPHQLPIYAVSSLRALAMAAFLADSSVKTVDALLDARMDELYFQRFSQDANGVPVADLPAALLAFADLPAAAAYATGSGALLHEQALTAQGVMVLPIKGAHARDLLTLYERAPWQATDATHFSPVYLRDKVV